MKSENVVQTKSYDFALKIIRIGANVEESIGGQSKADFFAKITIAYKETRETSYWIRLLKDSDYLTPEQSDDLLKDVEELLKIIGSIQKSVRNS